MTHIQAGRVVYGRTIKTGDYENKKVEVELSFNVEDGQDADVLVTQVGQMAVLKAHELLGLKTAPATVVTGAKPDQTATGGKEAAAASMNAADKTGKAGKTGKTGKPPKATKPADDDLPSDPDDAAAAAKRAEHTVENGKVEKAADDLEDFDAPSAKPEITDVDLTKAAAVKNAELTKTHSGAAPGMIRALRDKFFADPAGKQLKDIPQERREEFLKQLIALK